MKRLIQLGFLYAALAFTACTSGNGSDKFKHLTANDSFKKAHDVPAPTDIKPEGEMITLPVKSGATATAYLHKSSQASNKYLLVFHEWWGLNNYIKGEADSYAKEFPNLNVMAIDMYDGKVATTQDDAAKLSGQSDDARIRNIIAAAMQYAGDKAEIGTLGWCFGGGWSLQSAIMGGKKIKACVMYYGMPEESRDELKKLDAPVLGIFGTQDKFINPQVVKEFQANMEAVHKPLEVKSYDAVHAFANPSNPKYNKEAAADARKLTDDFLKKNLIGH